MMTRMDHWLPLPVSMGCSPTLPGGGFDGHRHDGQDELCLVADHGSLITHGGRPYQAQSGTLFLFRRGEWHGYRNGARQAPDLWIVHYRPDEALYRSCPRLADPDPRQRMWRLDAAQLEQFRVWFRRLQAERATGGASSAAASSAWLRLLLIAVDRWASGGGAPAPPSREDAEVAELWRHLEDNVHRADAVARSLSATFSNYDALRHRFVAAVGMSPRRLLTGLRMERARHLLLETDLPMSAIAERLGFARQHEFARAFAREVGCPPTAWRRRPVER